MSTDWKSWCRLCAKENGSEVNVFIKHENVNSIAEAIQRFFLISINSTDVFPTKICNICHDIVAELINFSVRSVKVQEMFTELEFGPSLDGLALEELRVKYGLNVASYDFKCLKDSQNSVDFLKDDNETTNSTRESEEILNDNPVQLANETTSENVEELIEKKEDKMLLKLKIKKQILIQKRKSKRKKKRKREIVEETSDSSLQQNDGIEYDDNYRQNYIYNDMASSTEYGEQNNMPVEVDLNIENIKRESDTDYTFSSKKFRKDRELNIICGICNKGFNNKGSHSYHMKVKHDIVVKVEPIICRTCGKTFKKQSKLEEHENMHLPPEERKWYPCPQCNKKFAVQTSIQLHIRAVHVREKSFICEECGKAFVTCDQLNSHKVVHTDYAPFQCPKCPKAFKRLPSLKNHIDSHEDTKYICPVCGLQLNTKTILRRHMVIHSDEKKYKCNFCQKEFKRTKALKNHLILHTGLKPYECPFCDQTFANGSNCRKHQKNSHPVELAAMEESGEKKSCKNVPRLEHLKAVNNAAICNNMEFEMNPKIEKLCNEEITKFCSNNAQIQAQIENQIENDSKIPEQCNNIDEYEISPKIEEVDKISTEASNCITPEEISTGFQN